jgi:hypothetical protein
MDSRFLASPLYRHPSPLLPPLDKGGVRGGSRQPAGSGCFETTATPMTKSYNRSSEKVTRLRLRTEMPSEGWCSGLVSDADNYSG